MSIRSFFGKLRRKILRVLLGREFLEINTHIQMISDTVLQNKEQVTNELRNIKTLLFLKEMSPELVKKFASGLRNDGELIDSLFNTAIFSDVRYEFNSIMWELCGYLNGPVSIPFDSLRDNLIGLSKNPFLKGPAFSSLANFSIMNYQDEELAGTLEQIYEPDVLADHWAASTYICFLLLRKEDEKAAKILKEFLERHDINSIVGFLPVANLAHRLGITNEDINAASRLFETIAKNAENKLLENYIANYGDNATIAIVGNGPHEVGLGKGGEIDAHDIVVRFNDFAVLPDTIKDYGEKTNLIVTGLFHPPERTVIKRGDILIFAEIYGECCPTRFLEEYKREPFSNITVFPPMRREMLLKYRIRFPSGGFSAVYYFKGILKKHITKSDVYGMALNTGILKMGHYDDVNKFIRRFGTVLLDGRPVRNDFLAEYKAMLELFNDK
ncbi:MAG: glycosyltransferase family 29 protein [Bacteroidales bacterium]|jgi:hypothetical protein|nr:glycosyltransferase family 29 protein [Bacteroidales bacterium]